MFNKEDDNMDMGLKAHKDVLMAIKKLASEAMAEGMDDGEDVGGVVAKLDVQKLGEDEAKEAAEEAMEGEMPEMDMMSEEEDEDMADELKKRLLKGKLGL